MRIRVQNSLLLLAFSLVVVFSGCTEAPNYREVLDAKKQQEELLKEIKAELKELKEDLKEELVAELRSELQGLRIAAADGTNPVPVRASGTFDPPASLKELDAQVEWVESPVVNSLEKYREYLESQEHSTSVEEALKIRNDSDENNDKILSALGNLYQSENDIDYEAEYVHHLPVEVKSFNPLMQNSTAEFDIGGMISLGLFNFDWNMDPFAADEYIKSWHTSQDKRYDKIVMRDDITWSDGQPITAYDVEFSYRTILDEEIPIPAVRSGMNDILGIQVYDDHTFVIFHKQSLATNIWSCNFPIIPRHIYEDSIPNDKTMADSDHHIEQEQNPVCGGPYKVKSRSKTAIILERREDWYMSQGKQIRRKPHFKQIRYSIITDPNTQLLALNKGDIDDLELQPAQWVNKTSDDDFYRLNTKARGTQWVYYFFGWNIDTPYFSDVKVRKALAHIVDYDHILGTLLYGLYPQCTSVFHPDSWMGPKSPRTPYHQDLAKAAAMLKEAGWVDTDKDGIRDKMIDGRKVRFEFTLLVPNQSWRVDICNSLANTLNRIGIKCKVKPTEFTVYTDQALKHEFDALFGGWGTGTDPWTTENIFMTGEGRNFVNYSNRQVDRLFKKAKLELDRDKRAEYYREIDDILWDEQPYCWLFYRSAFYGFNKKLRGYKFSPRGPFHYGPGFDAIWATAQ